MALPDMSEPLPVPFVEFLMKHEAPKKHRVGRKSGLHFPKHTGELAEVPDVLKGLVREDA